MIRMTQRGVVVERGAIERLRDEFQTTGCAMLPGFLSPPILEPLLEHLEFGSFYLKDESTGSKVFGRTFFAPPEHPILCSLIFMLNSPVLFDAVHQIAGCKTIANFVGRMHRTVPEGRQMIDWHNDLTDQRVLALNMNLSTKKYSGGLFEIRGPEWTIPTQVAQTQLGDAFLFRIDPGWNHRLTPVESGERVVSVGWFRSGPNREQFTKEWFPRPLDNSEAAYK